MSHHPELDQLLKPKNKTSNEKPSLWKVLLLNDDYTTMDFVTYILQRHFHKSHDDAAQLTLQIHREGKGIAGVYTHEIAETKVYEVVDDARKNGFPLLAVMEKE